MSTSETPIDPGSLAAALDTLPAVGVLREKLEGVPVWLVGGVIRDLLLDRPVLDIDLVVEGNAPETAALLGEPEASNEWFGTASVLVDGMRIDIAGARRETYARPGALPQVEPAGLGEDLARRDFTVNTMAAPLGGAGDLVDPHGGVDDLRARVLRVLHDGSFVDDPTRALRAARYAARLGLQLEARTAELLGNADLATVSPDRVETEIRKTVADPSGPGALRLLNLWGLAGVDSAASGRLEVALELLDDPDWAELVSREDAALEAALPNERLEMAAVRLSASHPARPSDGVALVKGRLPVELLAARWAGADWLDDWVHEWRKVQLEIDGEDLMSAGVPEGPAVGRGLAAALAATLDGEATGREEQLRIALQAAA